jgi:4a-hydroxytetrahydrobiopterin dehydratase
MTQQEIEQHLATLPGWRFDGVNITRLIRTENWKGAMLLSGAIGHLAELAWHHPELVINYGSVEVRLHTHSAGGVTDKDFALAEKINALIDWKPAQEGVLEGTPNSDEHRYLKDRP